MIFVKEYNYFLLLNISIFVNCLVRILNNFIEVGYELRKKIKNLIDNLMKLEKYFMI